jgi:hypothetical protein
MKTLIITAAVWGLLAMMPSKAQVSLGICGAREITLPPAGEATLIGFNFATQQPLALEEVFGTGSLVSASDPADADGVYLWNDGGQAFVQYFRKGDGNFYKASDPNGSPVAVTVESGDALFLRSPAISTATNRFYIAGPVSLVDITEMVYGDTIVFANPYPADLNLNRSDIDWSAATAGALPTLADQVHIWSPEKIGGPGFENYYLKSVGGSNEWYSGVSPFMPADPIIPAGGGAVYTAIHTFTNQVVRPFDI